MAYTQRRPQDAGSQSAFPPSRPPTLGTCPGEARAQPTEGTGPTPGRRRRFPRALAPRLPLPPPAGADTPGAHPPPAAPSSQTVAFLF